MTTTPDAPTYFTGPNTLECLSCGMPITDEEAADSLYCDECR